MDNFNLSAWALRNRSLTLFMIIAVAAAGIWAYLSLGRAEDPPFTIKQMVIVADWPGASADETMREVTDRMERKLEELPSLDHLDSIVQPGHTVITVSLKDSTPPADVPGLWYQVRKKIADIQATLPAGLQGPYFNDEFGDVYGIVYGFTGEGFTLPQLRHVAEDVRESLLAVPGVGKITLLGEQDERIYIDFSYRKLAQLGLSVQDVLAVVRHENNVASGGFVDTPHNRIFVRTGNGAEGADSIARLPISVRGHLVPLADIATISRGVVEPTVSSIAVNGKPALALGISMAQGGNILDLGKRIAARMAEIEPGLPLGVHAVRFNDQSLVVARDVSEFQESFFEALAIVLLVSFVSLGWRTGLVVAISVPLVLAGVLVGMKLLGIDLQRISLGAMIIALGLLVDDAIIAVETMLVKLEQGWDRVRAGSFAFTSTAFPMLTGTLITAAGYLPVGLAQSSTGEYTRDIFRVVGLSLVISWFVAVLFVPYLGALLLPAPKHHEEGVDAEAAQYDTRAYRAFRAAVAWCIRRRWIMIGATLAVFLLSVAGFTRVSQQFFPSSDRLEVLVDLRLPEGASYAATATKVEKLQNMLRTDPGVASWAAYIGVGTPRFFLAFSPELESANYAQFVINTKSVAAREALLARLHAAEDQGAAGPFADVRLRSARLELGPPVGYPVQFRVIGPDQATLRRIGAQVQRVMEANTDIRNASQNWGNFGMSVTIAVDQDKARLLGLSSEDVADTLGTLLTGTTITQYREGLDLIPVVARAVASERKDLADLPQIDILSQAGRAIPLSQIATVSYGLEQPTFRRRDRMPALLVQADVANGVQAPDVTAAILPYLAPVKASLPDGYRIETAGAVEEAGKGQASVNAIMPLMVLAMLTLLMVQLRNFGRVAMVILTAPLGLIGVAAALLATGAPFGFVAMLGFIALAGIIMRNSVILVDQIERDLRGGTAPEAAIIAATARRARPIVLTAAAAILALVPLAFSVFWGPMAIAIMGGLVSATLLTLFFVPALYAAWTRVPRAVATPRKAEKARGFAPGPHWGQGPQTPKSVG
jgi:multidrug efflux pump